MLCVSYFLIVIKCPQIYKDYLVIFWNNLLTVQETQVAKEENQKHENQGCNILLSSTVTAISTFILLIFTVHFSKCLLLRPFLFVGSRTNEEDSCA